MVQAEQKREEALAQIEAARRAAIMRQCAVQEEEAHYSEAIDGYRQIIEQYAGTQEEEQAKERMMDLAYLFETEGQTYRAKHLYWLLELLYTPQRYSDIRQARSARVKEILAEIHTKDREEELQRKELGLDDGGF